MDTYYFSSEFVDVGGRPVQGDWNHLCSSLLFKIIQKSGFRMHLAQMLLKMSWNCIDKSKHAYLARYQLHFFLLVTLIMVLVLLK